MRYCLLEAQISSFSPMSWSFAGYGFQTLADFFILLDLTEIIAFDGLREPESRWLVA